MDGFYKRERFATFTADGWYRTGDLGWFDDEGLLHFAGRGAAMIKTAGSHPREELQEFIGPLPQRGAGNDLVDKAKLGRAAQ